MRSRRRLYALLAAGLAASLAAFEVIRLGVAAGASPGYTLQSSIVGGSVFAIVLGVAALGLALRKPFGWVVGALAAVEATAHGIVVRAGGGWVGVGYMLGGLVLLGLLVMCLPAFRRDAFAHA